MDYRELVESIKFGKLDEYLDGIALAVSERRKSMQPQIWEFAMGERVRIKSTAKPTYLRGAKATIKKINRTRIVIDFDEPQGRFHRNVTTPPHILERV